MENPTPHEKKINMYKVNTEVQKLLKIGLPENMAVIVASANNGIPEMAHNSLSELEDEQSLIKSELDKFVPFEQNTYVLYDTLRLTHEPAAEDEIATIQH